MRDGQKSITENICRHTLDEKKNETKQKNCKKIKK